MKEHTYNEILIFFCDFYKISTRLKQFSYKKEIFLGELHIRLLQKFFEPIMLGLTISKKERKKEKKNIHILPMDNFMHMFHLSSQRGFTFTFIFVLNLNGFIMYFPSLEVYRKFLCSIETQIP
jgi:hypothetical protein